MNSPLSPRGKFSRQGQRGETASPPLSLPEESASQGRRGEADEENDIAYKRRIRFPANFATVLSWFPIASEGLIAMI